MCSLRFLFIFACLMVKGINKMYESNTSSCSTKFKDMIENQTKQLALKPVKLKKIRANFN